MGRADELHPEGPRPGRRAGRRPRPGREQAPALRRSGPRRGALLPALLALHHERQIPLPDLLRTVTVAPANLMGLKAGRLAKGAPADLVLCDITAPIVIDADRLISKSKNPRSTGDGCRGRCCGRSPRGGRCSRRGARGSGGAPAPHLLNGGDGGLRSLRCPEIACTSNPHGKAYEVPPTALQSIGAPPKSLAF